MLFDVIYIVIAVVILYLFVKLLHVPFVLLYNGILGAIMLWVLNIFGPLVGVNVNITVINSLIAGFFGVPGVIFLIIYKYLF